MAAAHGHRVRGKFSLTYNTWRCMVRRCTDPKHPMHKHYLKVQTSDGSIGVHAEWRRFERFFADMGKRPSRRHTLDRVDRTKGYEATNCAWATPRQQARNRDDFGGRVLVHPKTGAAHKLAVWARKLGITARTLRNRILRGLSLEVVLTKGRLHALPKGR